MTATPWRGHLLAEAEIACSGVMHRLRWTDGELTALDHGDPEAERTLGALGGDSYPCLEILGMWSRHCHDLRVLSLGSRGAQDPLVLTPPIFPAPAQGFAPGAGPATLGNRVLGRSGFATAAYASSSVVSFGPGLGPGPRPGGPMHPMRGEQDDLVTLMSLGAGLPERLVLTVAHHWAERLAAGSVPEGPDHNALTVALFGRATMAMRSWLGNPGLQPEVVMIGPGGPSSLARVGDKVEARLPFRWLIDVWSRGLAVMLDRFSVELEEEDDGHLGLLTASRPDFEPARLVIEVRP
jgi:hypothetical protein